VVLIKKINTSNLCKHLCKKCNSSSFKPTIFVSNNLYFFKKFKINQKTTSAYCVNYSANYVRCHSRFFI